MWDWINCRLAGRHEFVVWTDSKHVFLRCTRCHRETPGWDLARGKNDGAPAHDADPQARHGVLALALSLFSFAHR